MTNQMTVEEARRSFLSTEYASQIASLTERLADTRVELLQVQQLNRELSAQLERATAEDEDPGDTD